MEALAARVRCRDQAVLRQSGDVPYEGGADGGVFPNSLLKYLPVAAPKDEPLVDAASLVLRQTCEKETSSREDGQTWYRWSLALETEDGDANCGGTVACVRFEMHPTFKPSCYDVKEWPFSIGPFTGWGTFDVGVHIIEHSGKTTTIKFPLSFRRSETTMSVSSLTERARGAGA